MSCSPVHQPPRVPSASSAVLSHHAVTRGRKRLSLSQQAMMRMAELALENGIKHADTAGALNRYLDGLYLQHGTANNTRIYGEIVFIFHGSKLITVYPLPGEFKRTVAKIRKKKKEGL